MTQHRLKQGLPVKCMVIPLRDHFPLFPDLNIGYLNELKQNTKDDDDDFIMHGFTSVHDFN